MDALLLASLPLLGCQPALPQGVLDHLLQTDLDALVLLGGPAAVHLDVAEDQQVAEVGLLLLLREGVRGGDLGLGLLAQDLALGVQLGEEGGRIGLGGVAQVAVYFAEGTRRGEIRVCDAGAGELKEAFEQLE